MTNKAELLIRVLMPSKGNTPSQWETFGDFPLKFNYSFLVMSGYFLISFLLFLFSFGEISILLLFCKSEFK